MKQNSGHSEVGKAYSKVSLAVGSLLGEGECFALSLLSSFIILELQAPGCCRFAAQCSALISSYPGAGRAL